MKKLLKRIFIKRNKKSNNFLTNGAIPWSQGYNEYKWNLINVSINDSVVLEGISKNSLPIAFGYRVDERVVEYPWIFSNLSNSKEKLLDAGSTFNFKKIVRHPKIDLKDLTIFTFSPEKNCFHDKSVSYVYGDLRTLPFRDDWFDTIVSQSTIEHIDMDNSIYGYDVSHNEDVEKKSYEYLDAVMEMIRVLKSKGNLLITIPFGKFENHGFFQQFDDEMLNRVLDLFENRGEFECTFFKYNIDGWVFSEKSELADIVSYNPHTGKGKLKDNAAHCRSVVCIKFTKS